LVCVTAIRSPNTINFFRCFQFNVLSKTKFSRILCALRNWFRFLD
jgi:hypothetical protein